MLCSESKNAPDSIRVVGPFSFGGALFFWLAPPPGVARRCSDAILGWGGCLDHRISSGVSAISVPVIGNRHLGQFIYQVVRRGVKRRYSFMLQLFVFGTGAGLLAVALANSLAR